jgi:hypothetical protein
MEFITYLQQELEAYLPEVIASYGGKIEAGSLSEMEATIRQLSHELGGEVLRACLEGQTPKYPEDEVKCPHCGEAASYVARRTGTSITLLGRIQYRRPYYGCQTCHQGHYPLDEALGIQAGQMSDEVVKLAALQGVQNSFATSRDLLMRTALLDLSANSIRKACHRVGRQITTMEEMAQQDSQDLDQQREHQRSADKPARIYGSMDGFKVHLDGDWHEMKAGCWWTTRFLPNGELEAENITYYVDYLSAADFSEQVWATGFERLADQAHDVIFVADGAEWIWNIVAQHFPKAIQILDWYHALSYVQTVAQAAIPDAVDRTRWLEQQREHLWHGRRSVVFRACRQLLDIAPDPVRKALTFFANQRSRMHYGRYRTAGYQIGSGTMESGCKQLGVGRLKIAGAQWQSHGARLLAKARATYLNGDWDELNMSPPSLPQIA